MSALYIVAECIVYVLGVACVGAAIWGNVKLLTCSITSDMFLRKRGLTAHFGINFALIAWIISVLVLMMSNTNVIVSAPRILSLSAAILTAICPFSFICFSIIKAWMIYYKEKWSYFTLQSEWQRIINEKTDKVDTNWFIRNNQKYGSARYVTKISVAYHSICLSVCIVGMIADHFKLFPNVVYALIVLPFLPSIVFYLFVVCKTTRSKLIQDPFSIHWERKLHSRLQLLLFASVLIVSPLQMLHPTAGWLVSSAIPITILYAMIHVSTFSLYTRWRRLAFAFDTNDDAEKSFSRVISLSSANSANSASNSQLKNKITLQMVLSKDKPFNLLMRHLFREYSSEILLSLIEIQQYATYLQSQMEATVATVESQYYDISLPKSVPISSIVEDETTDFRMKAYRLYQKYIRVESEYEVNISWEHHNRFAAVMDDVDFLMRNQALDMADFHAMFVVVQKEMMRLLKCSFQRFAQRDEFEKVVAFFAENELSGEEEKTENV